VVDAVTPASRLVDLCRSRVGEAYVLGCRVDYDDPNHRGPWDCAEILTWAVRQVTGHLVGVTSGGDAYSGAWASLIAGRVSPEVAAATVGAVLVRAPGVPGRSGHVALSTGRGLTVEAYSTSRGVIASSSLGRRWDVGILVPGIGYELRPPMALVPPAVLRTGSTGEAVRAVQRVVGVTADGVYGPRTTAAVVAWQAAHGLVADGEAGPLTLTAMGL